MPGSKRLAVCVIVALSGCTFSNTIPEQQPIDASPDEAPGPVSYWATTTVTRGTERLLVVHTFDAQNGTFLPCTEQPAPSPVPARALLSHPTLGVVYGVESGFHGFTLSCSGITASSITNIGGARALQRIVLDATKAIGFFTMDGSDAIGVFRFTVGSDGAPMLAGSGDATSQAGPLVLDSQGGNLYVAGPSQVSHHALVGASLDLPATRTNAAGCGVPIDLALTSESVLEFCSDVTSIRRYTRSPFAFDRTIDGFGGVGGVVMLPGGRAVAARSTPPALVIVDLEDPAPTWVDGPALQGSTRLAASTDGQFLVTATSLTPTTTQVATWRIDGDNFMLLDTQDVDGVVTAIAVTRSNS